MSDEKPENQKQEKSYFDGDEKIARQFINKGAQTLIRWMPLGGSGGFLISFLLKQQWLMALAMFPIMIVTVAWAAFTESFLTKIQAYAQEFGEHGAVKETIEQTLDEYLEDTDFNKTLKQEVKQRLIESQQKTEAGEKGISLTEVINQLNIRP